MTGDVGETFNAMKAERQRRRKVHKKDNERMIAESGLPHTVTNEGQTMLFREKGKPKVDFYPSSGRWRAHGKTFDGGARSFLNWYAKQTEEGT